MIFSFDNFHRDPGFVKPSMIDHRKLLFAAGILLLLGSSILFMGRTSLAAPQLVLENGSIGSKGPLKLIFSEPVEEKSVESRLSLDPYVDGRFEWVADTAGSGSVLFFWPDQVFSSYSALRISLQKGVTGLSGRMLRKDQVWNVVVREPEVLYLAPTNKPDLWKVSLNGGLAVQLTFTGGRVYDFGVSLDGNRITYSVWNDQGGLDLWEIDRDGGAPRLLLPCQADWCFSPAYSPDGSLVAYSRRPILSSASPTPGNPRVWILNTDVRSTDLLSTDPQIGGVESSWSPDGHFLSFFDDRLLGIWVIDLETSQKFFLQANTGFNGSWSPDSTKIVFTNSEEINTERFGSIQIVDVRSQKNLETLGAGLEPIEYSTPEWSPNAKEVAVALRKYQGNASKQILILGIDGRQQLAVTQDQRITNASFHWSPSGDQLVFQRLEIGSSENRPWVEVWSRGGGDPAILAEDAFRPCWLP